MDFALMHSCITRLTKAALPMVVVLMTTGCIGTVGHQYIKTDPSGKVTELKKYYVQQGNEFLVTADLTGPVVLSDDTLTIKKMTAGSSIRISNTESEEVLKITEQNGKATYSLLQHKRSSEPSTKQINTYMQSLFNFTPLAAEERISALVKHQGVAAAVQQVEQAQNDDTKSAYILEISKLTLDKNAQKRVLTVLSSISSDYSQKVAALAFVETQTTLSQDTWLALFEGLENVASDYELRTLLSSIATKLPDDNAVHSAFFDASETIDSDYEKYRLVSEIATQATSLQIKDMLAASNDIGSDYEAYRLMSDIAQIAKSNDDINAMLVFIQSIDSDYEMQRAFKVLPYSLMSEAQTANALDIAGAEIGSDYELAKVLVNIYQQSPHKVNLATNVKQAMQSISSESDKLKVYEVL